MTPSQEFDSLPLFFPDITKCSAAVDFRNCHKNRYIDILAQDHTRVKLLVSSDTETDYINADYIDLGCGQRTIACQAPIESTLYDFWNMIFTQDVKVIVMLANMIDCANQKCYKYWPGTEFVKIKGIIVETVNIEYASKNNQHHFCDNKRQANKIRNTLSFYSLGGYEHTFCCGDSYAN
jgi:receptor-type tyrosine-protein phosphatase gamma